MDENIQNENAFHFLFMSVGEEINTEVMPASSATNSKSVEYIGYSPDECCSTLRDAISRRHEECVCKYGEKINHRDSIVYEGYTFLHEAATIGNNE